MAMRTQITPPWPYCAHSWMQRRPFGCSRLSNYSVVVPDVVRFASGWVLVFSPMILVGYGLTLPEDLSAVLIGVQRRVFPSDRSRWCNKRQAYILSFVNAFRTKLTTITIICKLRTQTQAGWGRFIICNTCSIILVLFNDYRLYVWLPLLLRGSVTLVDGQWWLILSDREDENFEGSCADFSEGVGRLLT